MLHEKKEYSWRIRNVNLQRFLHGMHGWDLVFTVWRLNVRQVVWRMLHNSETEIHDPGEKAERVGRRRRNLRM